MWSGMKKRGQPRFRTWEVCRNCSKLDSLQQKGLEKSLGEKNKSFKCPLSFLAKCPQKCGRIAAEARRNPRERPRILCVFFPSQLFYFSSSLTSILHNVLSPHSPTQPTIFSGFRLFISSSPPSDASLPFLLIILFRYRAGVRTAVAPLSSSSASSSSSFLYFIIYEGPRTVPLIPLMLARLFFFLFQGNGCCSPSNNMTVARRTKTQRRA